MAVPPSKEAAPKGPVIRLHGVEGEGTCCQPWARSAHQEHAVLLSTSPPSSTVIWGPTWEPSSQVASQGDPRQSISKQRHGLSQLGLLPLAQERGCGRATGKMPTNSGSEKRCPAGYPGAEHCRKQKMETPSPSVSWIHLNPLHERSLAGSVGLYSCKLQPRKDPQRGNYWGSKEYHTLMLGSRAHHPAFLSTSWESWWC